MIAPRETERVESLCWCQQRYVWIYPAAVRAGQTHACNNPECHPPNHTRANKYTLDDRKVDT